MSESKSLPKSFWVISILGLIWNLFGLVQFFVEYNYWKNPDARLDLPQQMQGLYDDIPGWLYILFAIAVVTGVLACVGLLMRKSWAVLLFIISLVTLTIQMGYNLLATNHIETLGATAVIMPLIVIAIGAALYYYSKQCRAKGWLS